LGDENRVMTLYRELEGLNLDDLVDRFGGPAPEGAEYADAYYQDLANLIRSRGPAGEEFLRAQLDTSDASRLRAVLFALTEPPIEDPKLVQRLHSCVRDQRPLIVAEAVDGIARLGLSDLVGEVKGLGRHPSPYVRGAVLRFLRRITPDQALSLLVEGLKDVDFIVRENAADELGELRAVEAIPHLRLAEADPHPAVRAAAHTALELLLSLPGQEKKESEP
jgi:HEAT repeat protein